MFSWLLPHRLVPNLLKGPRTIGSIVVYIFSVGLILFGLSKVDSKAKPITDKKIVEEVLEQVSAKPLWKSEDEVDFVVVEVNEVEVQAKAQHQEAEVKQIEIEALLKAEEEANLKAIEEEAKRQAEIEAQLKAEEEIVAKLKAEEEANLKAIE